MSRPKKANKMHTSLRPNIQRFAREEARDARNDAEYVKEETKDVCKRVLGHLVAVRRR
jgi:hypothetical protein